MHDPTHELTKAVASGNAEALSRFYRSYFDDLYRIARQATKRDEAFCLDVVQDAMLRVIRSLPVLEHEPALRAWLRRTILSCAYDRLRAEARATRLHADAQHEKHGESETHSANEQLQWIEAELAAMDEQSSRLLIMRHRFGWTLARIGRELGLSPGAVDGRLSRIIHTLRLRAKEAGHDG